jgi:hypothetical protein
MANRARGTFDVKVTPETTDPGVEGASLGRMSRGAPQLTIAVAPDSGTDQLSG